MRSLLRTYHLVDPASGLNASFPTGTDEDALPDWFFDIVTHPQFDGEDDDVPDATPEPSPDSEDDSTLTRRQMMNELDELDADYSKKDNHDKLWELLQMARSARDDG